MKRLGCRETTFFFSFVAMHLATKAKEVLASFFLQKNSQKFAYVKKKQYFCTAFWQMTHFGRVGEWLKPTVC